MAPWLTPVASSIALMDLPDLRRSRTVWMVVGDRGFMVKIGRNEMVVFVRFTQHRSGDQSKKLSESLNPG